VKIKESKNLKYDKLPWRGPDEGFDKYEPENCILENFKRVDDKLNLFFKNGSQAIIRASNIEGGREIDLIEEKLPGFLGNNYEEILEGGI
jgi:alpha-mannosidase